MTQIVSCILTKLLTKGLIFFEKLKLKHLCLLKSLLTNFQKKFV